MSFTGNDVRDARHHQLCMFLTPKHFLVLRLLSFARILLAHQLFLGKCKRNIEVKLRAATRTAALACVNLHVMVCISEHLTIT